MSQAAPVITRLPADVVRQSPVTQAPNGVCYAVSGEITVSGHDLERMVSAVEELRSQSASFYAGALLLTIGSLLLTWLSLTG